MGRQSTTGKLAAVTVRQSKPKDKPYKLSDGGGMYLLINPNGSRYWRWKYRFNHKEKMVALGVHPNISMTDARGKVKDARQLLDKGIDPGTHKKHLRASNKYELFKPIAEEWLKKESGRWSKDHTEQVWQTIKADALPHLDNMIIKDIRTSDVLYVIKKIESRGALDVASRVKQRISSIFRYAVQTGYVEFNPVDSLKDIIQTRKVQHRKSLKQEDLPTFLKALDNYPGYALTKYALQLIAYTFVRPGELRSAEWVDFDIGNSIWRIPAEKMKMEEEHIVPLSTQAIRLLEITKELTGSYSRVFPGSHDHRKPMSENTLTYAIRKRLHFDTTAHGFRTVDPTQQNKGLGSVLLEHTLQVVDQDKKLAYLESTNEANLTLYQRHGFELTGNIQAGSPLSLFPMIREPR